MPEQCDYLLWHGREAGLTCLESPDVAIYRVNVFQGFRRENTPTELSALTGYQQFILCWRDCSGDHQTPSEIKSALPQKFPQVSGSWWPHLMCCSKLAVPIPERWAHLVLSSESSGREQEHAMQPRQTALFQTWNGKKPLQTHTEGLQLERGSACGEKRLISKLSPSLNWLSLSICKLCYTEQ